MSKWEYTTLVAVTNYSKDVIGIVKIVNNKQVEDWSSKEWSINSTLQQLGEEGWELVNVMPLDSSVDKWGHWEIAYYFKRPKM